MSEFEQAMDAVNEKLQEARSASERRPSPEQFRNLDEAIANALHKLPLVKPILEGGLPTEVCWTAEPTESKYETVAQATTLPGTPYDVLVEPLRSLLSKHDGVLSDILLDEEKCAALKAIFPGVENEELAEVLKIVQQRREGTLLAQVQHGGADEGGRNLVAFFYSNPLVYEDTDKESMMVVKKEVNPALDHLEVFKIIKDCLVASGRQTRLRYEHATGWNMRRRLSAGCQILHFTGHRCDQYLAFEAEEAWRCGMMEQVDVDTLKKLFQHGSKPDLVFLESGGSHTHGREIAEDGVPHVIAVEAQTELPGATRKILSKAFYYRLLVDKMTVKEAFDLAVTTVNAGACTTGVTFHLFPKDGNHEVRLFDDLHEGEFVDETPQLPLAFNLPAARGSYFGKIKLQKAIELLLDADMACLSFVGERGIGKLERALQACNYVRRRGGFGFDAIFYADCLQSDILDECSPSSKEESFPYTEGGDNRSNVRRRIGLALGMPRESAPSARELWDFLVTSTQKEMSAQGAAEKTPPKILLLLKDVDALYEGGGVEARKSVIDFLDELYRINGNVKLLLTCEKQLLENANAYSTSTKEKVHNVLPLSNDNSVKLLMHLLTVGIGSKYADVNFKSSFNYEEAVERLQRLPLAEEVNGHPGTLFLLGPDLLDLFQNDSSDEEIANMYLRYHAQFKKVRIKSFSSERAKKIAYEAGLQDDRLTFVWVEAMQMSNEGGRAVSGDDDNAYYRFVPWKYLCEALQNSLVKLQTAGGYDSRCDVPRPTSPQSMGNRGSGQNSASERYTSSKASWVGGSDKLGTGDVSSFRPRLLGRDELSFVLERLRARRLDKAGHRRGTRSRGNDVGGNEPIQPEYDNEDDIFSLEAFVKFCRWWDPVTTTLSLISNEWASVDPVKVQGFMGKREAERRLKEKRLPGVFLLRFSESIPGRLVLTSTRTRKESQDVSSGQARKNDSKCFPVNISHTYVTVLQNRRWKLHFGKGNDGICYSSLRDLVNDKVNLLTLYPSSAKEKAFETA